MIDAATRERLAGWVADVCEGDALADHPAAVRERAPGVLQAWLEAACARRGLDPSGLEAEDLEDALRGTVARLDLRADVHRGVPELCRDALAELERTGRVAEGRLIGLALASRAAAYQRAVAGKGETVRRPGAKVGRNDPCPCGSGRKFKQCCMRR